MDNSTKSQIEKLKKDGETFYDKVQNAHAREGFKHLSGYHEDMATAYCTLKWNYHQIAKLYEKDGDHVNAERARGKENEYDNAMRESRRKSNEAWENEKK